MCVRKHKCVLHAVIASLACMLVPGRAVGTVITFDEPLQSAIGFNGVALNEYLISVDGLIRVEAFELNGFGHFHLCNTGRTGCVPPGSVDEFRNWVELNHNFSIPDPRGSLLQGLRITRVDGGPFDFLGMALGGTPNGAGVAISPTMNFITGEGPWVAFTHPTGLSGFPEWLIPEPISFGAQFLNLTQIYLADPAAGGLVEPYQGGVWDNLHVEPTIPEPGSSLLVLTGIGLLGLGSISRMTAARKST